MESELSAISSSYKNDYARAVETLKKATALEEQQSPPSGPPDIVKPSHELLGETLLKANRPKEAVAAFKVSLARQPNRARSLIGLARALAMSHDTKAATKAYISFLRVWSRSDPNLPELKEAQNFAAKSGFHSTSVVDNSTIVGTPGAEIKIRMSSAPVVRGDFIPTLPLVQIPGGSFMMGCDSGNPNERPVHRVFVGAFAIGRCQITNDDYGLFLEATNHREPKHWSDPRFTRSSTARGRGQVGLMLLRIAIGCQK